MKIEDFILLLSGLGGGYLLYRWYQARLAGGAGRLIPVDSYQPHAPPMMPALAANPASSFAAPGRPFTFVLPALTIQWSRPSIDQAALPAGSVWNDEAEAYAVPNPDNSVELSYA